MENKLSNLFSSSIKALFITVFKLAVIVFAWLLKAGGIVLTKIGEAAERILIKKSQI